MRRKAESQASEEKIGLPKKCFVTSEWRNEVKFEHNLDPKIMLYHQIQVYLYLKFFTKLIPENRTKGTDKISADHQFRPERKREFKIIGDVTFLYNRLHLR